MQIKNKFQIILILVLCSFLFKTNVRADEFNITAKVITVDKENEVIVGTGSVKAQDSEGNIIYANKITYKKLTEYLLAEGSVKFTGVDGNIITTNKATYDKINDIVVTYDDSDLILNDGYKLKGKNISYYKTDKLLNSNKDSVLTDIDGNIIETTMFQYDVKNNFFSSMGKIKITDTNKNKYFFKELYIDTKKKEMIGSDVSVILNQESFGVGKESDPRLVSNDIKIINSKATLSKGVFTVCKKKVGKCPPWSLKAKEIIYDSVKKNIYYKNAILKIYNIPIFYLPIFFHPGPTVDRQSGFLFPSFTNSTALGSGVGTPYYWAINNDKDLTFTPKFYTKENFLYLNEYRQAFSKGFLTLDTSYTEGFKNTSTKKPKGSRNHIFGNFDWNFSKDDSYESNLLINVERTSNDTYFRKHNINTTLVNAENTNLTNKISYDYVNDDSYLNIQTNVYENLRGSTNARYEYVLPSILFGKTFFTEKYGSFDFKSNALHNNYEVNKYKTVFNNDLIWKPGKYLSANGFVSSFEGMLRNSNYKAKKTDDLKNGKTNNELNGVLAYKTSLPMKKEGSNYANFFSPNFMFRYAPGHMKNISSNSESLNYLTLYSLNKTSEIEDGISAVLGFDFKSKEKEGDKIIRERLSLSLGQIFNYERNTDMPSKTSLDQKMSDVVGEFNYNFSSIGNLNYKFLVDHNLESLNYNEISTGLNFGRIGFNLSYLEENKHIGNEKYASSGVVLNFNDNNKLDFSTKKNFKTDSTEFYNMRYQYAIDCLTAGLVYRREFYEDADLEPNNSLMFTLTFIPFGKVSSPDLNQ